MPYFHLRNGARRLLERMLRAFEYRLADASDDPTGLHAACENLKRRGFQPRTVIDVGVGNGTPWLYQNFPAAHFLLFEANTLFRPAIEQITQGMNATVHYCALGESPSELVLEENGKQPTSSSFATYETAYLQATGNRMEPKEFIRKSVPVQTLDEHLPFSGPVLLKLDVEGFEAHVLRGAHAALKSIDVIITEISVIRRTKLEPTFGEFVSILERSGFSLMNVAEMTPIGRGGPIAYMDAVFVRSDSPMRYGRRFE